MELRQHLAAAPGGLASLLVPRDSGRKATAKSPSFTAHTFPGIALALAPAAVEADDAVSRTIQPMRAFRTAMAVRAQPARANENLLGPVTAGAFLRTRQFLP